MRRLAIVLSLLATQFLAGAPLAAAAPPAGNDGIDVVAIPRALVAPIQQAILHPHGADVGEILAVVQQFLACIDDNPLNGMVRRAGQDQCPMVTEALAARNRELADARKAAAAAAQPVAPATSPHAQPPALAAAPPAQPPAPASAPPAQPPAPAAAADQPAAAPANAPDGHQ